MSSYSITWDPVNGRNVIGSLLAKKPVGYTPQQFRRRIISRLKHYEEIYKSPVLPLQDNSLIDWLANVTIYASTVCEALEFHKWLSSCLYEAFEVYYSSLGVLDLTSIGVVLDLFSFGILKPLELMPLMDKLMLHEMSITDTD